MVLTNLYPEHIEAHGGFENYKKAKLDIFFYAARYGNGRQKLPRFGLPVQDNEPRGEVVKTAVVNGDSEYADEFLRAGLWQRRYTFGQERKIYPGTAGALQASDIQTDRGGLHFEVDGYRFSPNLHGEHNAMNILAAITVARALGVDWQVILKAANALTNAPGRCEFIKEAEARGFLAIVDYAFEPKAMEALYVVAEKLEPKRIIHVFGSTGGGRDAARRFTLGQLAGERADICIVTDEDSYDDDPQKIIDDVASAAVAAGKRVDFNLYKILDRRAAIERAVSMAEPGDLVLVTGKGSEQAMCLAGGRKIPWDDREIVRQALAKRAA